MIHTLSVWRPQCVRMPTKQWHWKKCRGCGEYKRVVAALHPLLSSPSLSLPCVLSSLLPPLCYLAAPLPFIPNSFSSLHSLPLSLSLLWISLLFFCTPISRSPPHYFSLTHTLLFRSLSFFLFPTFAEFCGGWCKWACTEGLFSFTSRAATPKAVSSRLSLTYLNT